MAESTQILRYTQKHLIQSLEKQGFKFTEFSFATEGDFLPSDADWNYKDVPHLNLIHELVDANYGMIGDDMIATINLQKILGIRFPLTVFNYQSTPTSQTYFTSFFVYQLIIETRYDQLGPLRTRVTTKYAIGSAPVWQFFTPLLKWVLKRNFDNLMSADIPMRNRRGQLREWGYSFKGDGTLYSFRDTMKIHETNLVPPKTTIPSLFEARISLTELKKTGRVFVGRPDHRGLRVEFDGKEGVLIFHRTCPHEGARLDHTTCSNDETHCPWHGRALKPIAKLRLLEGTVASSASFSFAVKAHELLIQESFSEVFVWP